ncbi:MAG TPA: hypothetical protein VIW80_19565 [Pyrinomonadaceae bacterium]|jgi:hypothetical protein
MTKRNNQLSVESLDENIATDILPDDIEVTHTPIIIGDGSASIDFDKQEYAQMSVNGSRTADDLRLRSVFVDSSLGAHVCHQVSSGETCEITVICSRVGSEDKNFVIRGGDFVEIEFDSTEYRETHPNDVARAHHRNPNRQITAMTIRDSLGNLIHDCDLVFNGTERTITINDPHVER